MRRWHVVLLAFAVSCSGGRKSSRDASADRFAERDTIADRNQPDSLLDSARADLGAIDQAVADALRADSFLAEPDVPPNSRADTAGADRPPDQSTCNRYPSSPEACAQSTCVQMACDFFPPGASLYAPTSGPLLAEIRLLRGPCSGGTCSVGCSALRVIAPTVTNEPDGGATCDFLAISVDGRSEAFSLTLVTRPNPRAGDGTCCGRGGGAGYWYAEPDTYRAVEPSSVQLRFAGDAGADVAPDASSHDGQADNVGGDW